MRRKTLSDAQNESGTSVINPAAALQYRLDREDSIPTAFHGLGTVGTYGGPVTGHAAETLANGLRVDQSLTPAEASSSSAESVPFPTLQNPSDALGILAQVAETSTGENDGASAVHQASDMSYARPHRLSNGTSDVRYHLINTGRLTVAKTAQLLKRYQQHHHPYFPLAPPHTFDVSNLARTARQEKHLLTAILVISSKDLVEEPNTYEACSTYMQMLVSNLAAGGEGDIEAVEALLLLAEWTPYTQSARSGKVGRGEEDREAWMQIGLALRIGYFLGLDRTSFRVPGEVSDSLFSRKRLVWTACYISDRQISIRIGKAFWSRGPGPLTTLRREDYPSLLPQSPNDEDYASMFQATLELTSLFSNVHDVLYSNPGSSFRSHLSGGYIKFIDDFRSAIYGWKSVWGTLTCSPHLKATLLMSYDYLRLYTNAFAFQATIRRALPPKDGSTNTAEYQSPSRVFYNNVASVGDARFIYEGLDAAKSLLTTANNFVDPENSLRYMPLRFYLYLVYSGVFLYRARCVGVMSSEEERGIRAMIQETVSRLQRSSVGMHHLGSRYSQLLKLLWQKAEHKHGRPRANSVYPNRQLDAVRDVATPASSVPRPPSQAGSGESPAMTEQMGDFSWTDLTAVSDFAMNAQPAGSGTQTHDDAFWAGFLPLELSGAWDGGQLDDADLGMAF